MRLTRRQTMFGLAAVAGLGPIRAVAGNQTRLTGRAFGTGWSVAATAIPDPGETARWIEAALGLIDAEMSPFRPDSALSRFNAGAVETVVSADFQRVVQAALAVAKASGGAFDPTVGPAVNRYGFGPIRGSLRPGGWRDIRCEGQRLSARAPVTLDLCGIAKGFAVDALTTILARQSDRFIIEIGGEIRARGDWPVGIADPVRGGIHSRLRLADAALATSGDGVNGYDLAGRRWSHVIDPATGQPVRGGIASVSVIARDAMTADALATAALVMGEARGMDFVTAQGAEAMFLIREGGGLRRAASPGFGA